MGNILGKENVNVNFMSVAPASYKNNKAFVPKQQLLRTPSDASTPKESTEALMILGVDREVDEHVAKGLVEDGGVLSVSSVIL